VEIGEFFSAENNINNALWLFIAGLTNWQGYGLWVLLSGGLTALNA